MACLRVSSCTVHRPPGAFGFARVLCLHSVLVLGAGLCALVLVPEWGAGCFGRFRGFSVFLGPNVLGIGMFWNPEFGRNANPTARLKEEGNTTRRHTALPGWRAGLRRRVIGSLGPCAGFGSRFRHFGPKSWKWDVLANSVFRADFGSLGTEYATAPSFG